MKTGMLWFDNDPKTDFPSKVERAVTYYQHKYGRRPDICFVHPSMLAPQASNPAGIDVRPNRQVLPNHFWLGIQEASLAMA